MSKVVEPALEHALTAWRVAGGVPRAGVRVVQAIERTRWDDGRVHVWIGVRKETGRGEGHSGLAIDRVVPSARQRRPALRRSGPT